MPNVTESNEHLENIRCEIVGVTRFSEVPQILSHRGILEQGGIFLADVDKTLRDPYGDFRRLQLDRLPVETMQTLFALQQNAWEIAVVTNQPTKGHVLSQVTQAIRPNPYTRTVDFFARNDITVFAPSSGPVQFPVNSLGRTIRTIVDQNVTEVGGIQYAPRYKSSNEAVQEVGEWVLQQIQTRESSQIVWVGNTQADVLFAERLGHYLQERGTVTDEEVNILIFKMPDEVAK